MLVISGVKPGKVETCGMSKSVSNVYDYVTLYKPQNRKEKRQTCQRPYDRGRVDRCFSVCGMPKSVSSVYDYITLYIPQNRKKRQIC